MCKSRSPPLTSSSDEKETHASRKVCVGYLTECIVCPCNACVSVLQDHHSHMSVPAKEQDPIIPSVPSQCSPKREAEGSEAHE